MKNTDGSVTLQVGPAPFATQDVSIVNSGIAIIDCNTVVQNYTAAEVLSLDKVDISFTVTAHPNVFLPDGYAMYATMLMGAFNLDPKSVNFYDLQAIEISSYGLSGLYNVVLNSNNGFFSAFYKSPANTIWVSPEQGILLSNSYTDQAYFTTSQGMVPTSQTFTFEVDFNQVSNLAEATYTTLLVFRMAQISTTQTFLETLNYFSTIQQVQINYLYSSVLGVNAYLIGNNTLYDPVLADQVILNTSRTLLIAQYNTTLDAMEKQWTLFNERSNLSIQEQTLITQMLTYIETARLLSSNFDLL